jgi:phosphoribosylanthranilate isomerase
VKKGGIRKKDMHTRTRIKMCGTTSIGDAQAAVHSGVDALGFIFVGKSPRYISAAKAKEIVARLPPFVDPVGVFIDCDVQKVLEIVRGVGLSYVQLHGAEDPAYCRHLARMAAPCKVIKAFRVGGESRKADFVKYNDVVRGFLLDTYIKGQAGGTGRTFDWRLIKDLDLQRPVILAGGLRPGNILEAIRMVRPFGVDVNSGAEVSPGIKDHAKIHELIAQVRLADNDV